MTTSDLHASISGSSVLYELCPDLLGDFQGGMARLAFIVLCAIHNYDATKHPIEGVPRFIGREAIHELGNINLLPHLNMAFNPKFLEPIRHSDPNFLVYTYNLTLNVARAYARWILDRIAVMIRKGFNSQLNFGAFFGLTKEDFFRRVAPEVLQRTTVPVCDGKSYINTSFLHDLTRQSLSFSFRGRFTPLSIE